MVPQLSTTEGQGNQNGLLTSASLHAGIIQG